MYPILKLKAGKEGNVAFRHPWIFSGALEEIPPDLPNGSIVTVTDSRGRSMGIGLFSAQSMIAVRILEFGPAVIDADWFRRKIQSADKLRLFHGYGPSKNTTGYRVVFGEVDCIPGLVVDRYNDVIVIQIAVVGLDLMRDIIIESLLSIFKPRAIIERSDIPVRKEEGLEEISVVRYGDNPGPVEFMENGLRFIADTVHGQKTGFYLDQKLLRQEIQQYAHCRKVLNLFSYSGSAGIAALKGGARSALNIDSSNASLTLGKLHAQLNDIPESLFLAESSDVFAWLSKRDMPTYDMVIIDPPALIKSQDDFESGRKAYHFLNRAALRFVNDDGLLVTSSCSAFFTESDLAFTLRRASVQTGVHLDMLKIIRQSPDHPISIYFNESAYLKTFICRVRR
jgi:23S rRNA (cytosine1962-C5)-methyltransferase